MRYLVVFLLFFGVLQAELSKEEIEGIVRICEEQKKKQ